MDPYKPLRAADLLAVTKRARSEKELDELLSSAVRSTS